MNDADHIIVNRRDQLGLVVAVVGLVVIGLLAFSGSDIIGSVAGIAQLLIAGGVFILVLAYAIGVLLLEALDNRVGRDSPRISYWWLSPLRSSQAPSSRSSGGEARERPHTSCSHDGEGAALRRLRAMPVRSS